MPIMPGGIKSRGRRATACARLVPEPSFLLLTPLPPRKLTPSYASDERVGPAAAAAAAASRRRHSLVSTRESCCNIFVT